MFPYNGENRLVSKAVRMFHRVRQVAAPGRSLLSLTILSRGLWLDNLCQNLCCEINFSVSQVGLTVPSVISEVTTLWHSI